MLLQIKVSPRSKEDRIVGWHGGVLKLRVKANAEKGKANAAVVDLLSRVLQVPKDDVSIRSGHTSALKTVQIDRLPSAEVIDRLPKVDVWPFEKYPPSTR